jgi:flagellar motor switch/type III secretory pathway protein FliN
VPDSNPNFSPFPFDRLRRLTRREAAIESALARWLGAGRLGAKLAALVGGPVRARLAGVGVVAGPPDPEAARAEVRYAGMSIAVAASARPVRAIAQRLLGGPAELDAPRPLTVVEQAIWALAVGAGLADLGVAAEVWPLADSAPVPAAVPPAPGQAPGALPGARLEPTPGARLEPPSGAAPITVAFSVELPIGLGLGAGAAMTVTVRCPPDLMLRAPPVRPLRPWRFELPVVVGRCALARASLAGLRAGDVVTVERCCELDLGPGAIGLHAAPGAVEARVATEYVPRDMALPDDAMLEVTVSLGTTRLSLRQLGELAIGQIVALGRPLAGPYEVRAAGRLVGQGELVDIDGELGVRIVSIAEPPEVA